MYDKIIISPTFFKFPFSLYGTETTMCMETVNKRVFKDGGSYYRFHSILVLALVNNHDLGQLGSWINSAYINIQIVGLTCKNLVGIKYAIRNQRGAFWSNVLNSYKSIYEVKGETLKRGSITTDNPFHVAVRLLTPPADSPDRHFPCSVHMEYMDSCRPPEWEPPLQTPDIMSKCPNRKVIVFIRQSD